MIEVSSDPLAARHASKSSGPAPAAGLSPQASRL